MEMQTVEKTHKKYLNVLHWRERIIEVGFKYAITIQEKYDDTLYIIDKFSNVNKTISRGFVNITFIHREHTEDMPHIRKKSTFSVDVLDDEKIRIRDQRGILSRRFKSKQYVTFDELVGLLTNG